VQQDLALGALIGVTHAERNGHHYVDGFGTAPSGGGRGLPERRIPISTAATAISSVCRFTTAISSRDR
jgi:hypothetical protein